MSEDITDPNINIGYGVPKYLYDAITQWADQHDIPRNNAYRLALAVLLDRIHLHYEADVLALYEQERTRWRDAEWRKRGTYNAPGKRRPYQHKQRRKVEE